MKLGKILLVSSTVGIVMYLKGIYDMNKSIRMSFKTLFTDEVITSMKNVSMMHLTSPYTNETEKTKAMLVLEVLD